MRITLLVVLLVFAAPATALATCVPAANVEAVVEESPELVRLDPDGNRYEGLKLLALGSTAGAIPAAQIHISAGGVRSEGVRGFPDVDASTMVSSINSVAAELRCRPIETTFIDTFTRTATLKPKVFSAGTSSSADITVSWRSPMDIISIRKLRVEGSHKKLKITRSAGRTWVTLHVNGIRRRKLHFNLELKQMTSVRFGSLKVTTQIQRSSKG